MFVAAAAFLGHNVGPKADLFVAAAGPATHVPMVLIWLGGLAAATYSATGTASLPLWDPPHMGGGAADFGVALCAMAVVMNVCLFAFNLLVPCYPLDGGRILVGGLLTAGVSQEMTAKATLGVSVPLAGGILALGILHFQVVTILVAAFIGYACWQLFTALRDGALAQHPLFSYEAEAAGNGAPQEEASSYYKFGGSNI
ncbi:hypothetical protein FOA52_008350 [Chlamydomonas sp. UWO 241]|nr:hypothetical protein FOA52_008350 [Chlamydomonas sp. UWO 241]